MIREVYIDEQQIDIENDNAAGYIFTSPIFRDITKILSNRTTTYKVPKTQRNLTIFGLSNNPDVYSIFPYREHTFEEIRDGLTFIKGICTLLKSGEEDLELSVVWGNTINLLKLKDLKLRDMIVSSDLRTIPWNSDVEFITTSSSDQRGFIVVDFGKGVDIENMRPSITFQYILNLIESHSGVHFSYPDRFNDVFSKTWIPLIENKANDLTWEDSKYWVRTSFKGFTGSASTLNNPSAFKFDFPAEGNFDIIQNSISNTYTVIKAKSGSTVNINSWQIINAGNISSEPEKFKLKVYAYGGGTVYQEQYFDVYIDSDTNQQRVFINIDMSFDVSDDVDIEIRAIYTKDGINQFNLFGAELISVPAFQYLKIYVKYNEVRFGDIYPIVINLPDISVIDFLKTIMQMYGLFTYYDYSLDDSTIRFISIDDIYSQKSNSYNWTDKLVNTNKGRFNLSYVYGGYAQRNNLKYKSDDGVNINADGYIYIDNTTITESKDIVSIPFAPSDNTSDENNNQYAKINLFAADGSKQSISYRILNEDKYRDATSGIDYKSGIFKDKQKFSGTSGLLSTYYSSFQHILMQPVIAECYVYLKEHELHLFREVNPVYIDGVYYAPIEVTVQTDGLAVCKLIRMPYK